MQRTHRTLTLLHNWQIIQIYWFGSRVEWCPGTSSFTQDRVIVPW